MIQAMYNGVSGLLVHKTELDVISNNIANINTVGYKSARVYFREMLARTMQGATAPRQGGSGGTNPVQIGLGANIGSIDTSQTQGSLLPTGKPTDVAIEGDGFFMLSDGVGTYYTRDGSFGLDSEGNLVASGNGMRVLGWQINPTTGRIDNSQPISSSSGIKLPIGQMAIARQTSAVTFGGNLDAKTPQGEGPNPSVKIYDSLGTAHIVTITFSKTANPGEWTWEASCPDAAAGSVVGTGTLLFDSDGKNTVPSGSISLTLADANGAVNPVNMNLSFTGITQLAGESDVNATFQDGLPLGKLDSFSIGKDGVIAGMFTNGMTQNIAQLALAQFTNPSGLSKRGDNMVTETGNSGLPQVGQPSSGSRGNVMAGFLESSNVDLPTEFANMIVAQRGFQANSRIITTSDEILQELVQLKR
jgi:flagellar hook protein FlgE